MPVETAFYRERFMKMLSARSAIVLLIVLLVTSLPPSIISAELIGVARTTGPAQINGMSLPGQVNVFSGDRIGTGQDSTLTLSSGPQERVRLAAMSGAQVALEEGNLVISLEKGALGFESMGRTRGPGHTNQLRRYHRRRKTRTQEHYEKHHGAPGTKYLHKSLSLKCCLNGHYELLKRPRQERIPFDIKQLEGNEGR